MKNRRDFMQELEKEYLEGNVSSARTLAKLTMWLKCGLAATLAIGYFVEFSWLYEMVILSVIISLVLPLGFFGAFFENLIEYNTQLVEDRQSLNAKEANQHFKKAFKKSI
jgi:hypothetical protein